MKHFPRLLAAVLVCSAIGACRPAPLLSQEGSISELLAAGHYREAYEASQREAGAGSDGLAREILRSSLTSQDLTLRWSALQVIQPLHDPEMTAAVRGLATSSDRYERSLALEILGKVDPAANREELIAALDAPFRSIRVRALRGLMSLKDPDLGRDFAAVLRSDPDADLRALAARALGATGSAEFLPVLRQAVDDATGIVQREAVSALVTLGDPRLVGLLRRRLSGREGVDRVRVIRLCGLVPAQDLIGDLAPLLADDDRETRVQTAGAILSIFERQNQRKD